MHRIARLAVTAAVLALVFGGFSPAGAAPEERVDLAGIHADLQKLSIDPNATWRVRELKLTREGASLYFSEGVLAFATPVAGHRVAAVFTTEFVDAGDGEVIAFPPDAAERASLASFVKTPNLDEHFHSALLFMADDVAQELIDQLNRRALRPAPDLAPKLEATMDNVLRHDSSQIDVRLIESILDHHTHADGFLYAVIGGRTLGTFDFVFQPTEPDTLVFGRVFSAPEGNYFQIWCAFHAHKGEEAFRDGEITNYRLDADIHADLSMAVTADFDYRASSQDGRAIALLLSSRLRVLRASVDGVAADLVVHDSPVTSERNSMRFLIVTPHELKPGSVHAIHMQYEGTVVDRETDGNYFVNDRNAWYPFIEPMLSNFDLIFRCPSGLRVVSTGDTISDEIKDNERFVHRRTSSPQPLAGFNLGNFSVAETAGRYRLQICSNNSAKPIPDLAGETFQILQYFSERWFQLPNHTLAVTPIEGYFGQGFPGIIYLSTYSYLRDKDRPRAMRNPEFDAFFSALLLPHELAHQWWGNIVTPLDYRSTWIVEAMANYSALQFLEQTRGHAVVNSVLADYRSNLVTVRSDGQLVDSKGPVTFSDRLLNNFGVGVWHDILYEKGTWIMHMLRKRMGDKAFVDFQAHLVRDFARRPLSNEDLRREAARFIPSKEPDRNLTSFFDTWVYDTGIPTLKIEGARLRVSGVPDNYVANVPIQCDKALVFVRAAAGMVDLPSRGCVLPDENTFLFRN